jgi:membrane-bound lytic murein transglycosylase MltF
MPVKVRLIAIVAVLALLATSAFADSPEPAERKVRALPTDAKAWTGDFDGMIRRRHIRVLVPYSRSLYYNDKGRERGITVDFVRDFEGYINKKYRTELGKRPITIYIVPTTRDELLEKVAAGLGDIAAGNLTITDERRKLVDFAAPSNQRPMAEIVVTGPKSPAIATADDLAGRTVHVRETSSYHESLLALNARFESEGKAPAKLVLVPDALEDEDMMEMVNAGLLEAIVVDDWKARMWAQVLPKIKVNEGAVLRGDSQTGWAIRKGSPQLEAALLDFYANFIQKQNLNVARQAQYFKRIKQMKDPTRAADAKRFDQTLALFTKYGEKYDFDPLLLAAQGYQESLLDQNAKSHVGAVGIMQIMPATGAELNVGDINVAESNVHAGTKYMHQLMSRYFKDANFSEANRSLFAFASYNAGPGRISQMRKEAVKRGLDPDKWFNNVELVTAEKVGIETTTYVRNIFKYYVSYRLMLDVQQAQKKARESLN